MERDRADRSEAAAISSLDELTLQHAELLLATDPSAALDAITSYGGKSTNRAHQLEAEATGRGVATLRATPHTDTVHWIGGVATGEIIAMSNDGTISRTSLEGRTQTLATNAKKNGAFAYATSRHLLAYVCQPDDLCIMDITSGHHIHAYQDHRHSPIDLSYSPDDSQLALLSETGDLRVFDVRFPEQPTERLHFDTTRGGGVLFVEHDAIAVGTSDGLLLVHLDGRIQKLIDRDGTLWGVGPGHDSLVVATSTGPVYILNTNDLSVIARAQPCHDPVSGLKTVHSEGWVAFACKEGTIGTWNPQTGAVVPRAHLDGHANLLEVSQSGEYLVAGGDKGTLTPIDLKANVIMPLRGHGSRLTAIAPPTDEYPLLLSADVRGTIRAWPIPTRYATVRGAAIDQIYAAIYSREDQSLILSTRDSQLLV